MSAPRADEDVLTTPQEESRDPNRLRPTGPDRSGLFGFQGLHHGITREDNASVTSLKRSGRMVSAEDDMWTITHAFRPNQHS